MVEDRLLLRAAARVVMDGERGSLREQLKRPQVPFDPVPTLDETSADGPSRVGPLARGSDDSVRVTDLTVRSAD